MKLLRHEAILSILTLLFVLSAVLVSTFSAKNTTSIENPDVSVTPYLINVNTADKDELDLLNGIGPALAERIIEYRTSNGPFESKDELANVSGIGPATIENIKDYIEI